MSRAPDMVHFLQSTVTNADPLSRMDPRDLLFQPTTNDLSGECVSALSAGTVTDDQTWLLGGGLRNSV